MDNPFSAELASRSGAGGGTHPLTGRPMLDAGRGRVATEESITVTHPRLNAGKPTNIPSIWAGERPPFPRESAEFEDWAVEQALASRQAFPAFGSIDEAVTAAKQRSDMLGSTLNPFAAELERRTTEAPREEIPFGIALGRGMFNTFLDNIMELPRFIAKGATPISPKAMFVPKEEARQMIDERGGWVDGVLPTGRDLRSAVRAELEIAGDLFSGRNFDVSGAYERGRQAEIEADERFQREAPVGTTVGNFTGDAATVLSGRLPLRAAIRAAPAKAAPAVSRTGLRGQLDDIVNSRIVQDLKRGGIRATEAGLEGAMLAAMKDGDEITSAGLAAGAQAGGSLILTAAKETLGSKTKLLTAVAMSAIAVQLLKQATPGGRDRILESIETATFKVLPVAILGAFGAFAGAGRVGGALEKNLPNLADALTAIPRASMQSLVRDLAGATGRGDTQTLKAVEAFAQDPDAFGPAARRQLEQAIAGGRSITATVERLMKRSEFRRAFEKLDQ